MPVTLPYYPRKYTYEWLESLHEDTRVWTDFDLSFCGYSEQLELEIKADGPHLRFIDPKTGQGIPRPSELAQMVKTEHLRAENETARADTEAKARQDAEAEIARLRAELDAVRKS